MAKAGMRRPDPSEPHGTESNKKQKFPKNPQTTVGQSKKSGGRKTDRDSDQR